MLAIQVHVEGLDAVRHDEHLLERVEDGHRDLLEVDHAEQLGLVVFHLTWRAIVLYHACVRHTAIRGASPLERAQPLHRLQLPHIKPCHLLGTTTQTNLEADVLSLPRFVGQQEDVLVLDHVDAGNLTETHLGLEFELKSGVAKLEKF